MERTLGILLLLFLSVNAHAGAAKFGSQDFVVEGRLYNSSTGAPYDQVVDVKFEIFSDAAPTCVLYREVHSNIDVNSTSNDDNDGVFALKLGKGTATGIFTGGAFSLAKVFSNAQNVQGDSNSDDSTSECALTAASGNRRYLRIAVSPHLAGTWDVLSPVTDISSSPSAMVADTLQGIDSTGFVQVDASSNMTQAGLSALFTGSGYANLLSLSTGNMGSQRLQGVSDPTGANDAANKNYVDTSLGGKALDTASVSSASNGQVLMWNSSTSKWIASSQSITDASKLPLTGGTMTGAIDMGAQNITNIGHMTMAAQRTLNLGTYSAAQETPMTAGIGTTDKGKIWFNTTSNTLRVWNGTAAIDSSSPTGAAGGDLTGTYPNPTIGTGKVTSTAMANSAVTTAKVNAGNAVTGGALMVVDTVDTSRVLYQTCAVNEVLSWSAGTGWTCTSKFLAQNGAAALPAFSFSGDIDTGIYHPNPDEIAFATAGVNRMVVTSSGIGIGSNIPGSALDIYSLVGGGNPVGAQVLPYIAQGGTDSYTALLVNVTESTTGSGQKNLMDLRVGNISKARIDNNGIIYGDGSGLANVTGTISGLSAGRIVLSTSGTTVGDASTLTFNSATGAMALSGSTNAINATGNFQITSGSSNTLNLGHSGAGSVVSLNSPLTTASGNVGIGTTSVSAGARLDVEGGAVRVRGGGAATQGGQVRFVESTGIGNNYVAFRAADSIAADVTWELPSADGGSGQVLSTNGSGVLSWATVPASGGIFAAGTGTSATPTLSFSGDTDTGFYDTSSNNTISVAVGAAKIFDFTTTGLASPTTGGAAISTGNGTSGSPTFSFAGDLTTGWWRPAASTMAASIAGVEKFRIDSTGRIGIGTAAPTAKLHLDSGAVGTVVSEKFTVFTTTGMLASDGFDVGVATTGAAELRQRENLPLTIYTNNAARMTFSAAGAIGIGTLAPGAALDVVGDVYASTNITAQNNLIAYGQIQPPSGTVGSPGLNFGGLNTGISEASGDLSFSSVGSLTMILKGSGSLGLGTSSPSTKLDVIGAAKATSFQSGAGTVGAPSLTFSADTNTGFWNPAADTIAASINGTEAMRISNAGQVGIGTTAPTKLLHVFSTGSNYSEFGSNGPVDVRVGDYENNGFGGSLTLFKTRGNFGIPTDVLWNDEVGSLNYTGLGGGNAYVAAKIRTAVDGTPGTADMPGRLEFYTTPDGSGTPQERMRIANNGNIGIGTQAPGSTLDVNGTVKAVTFSGPITQTVVTASNGTVGAPSLSFNSDPNMGWWRPSGATMAASTNGIEAMRIDPSGNVGIGVTNPPTKLTVNGAILSGVYLEGVDTPASSGASFIIPSTNKSFYRLTLNNPTTITLPGTGSIPADSAFTLTIRVTQDATGFRTINWAGGTIKWDQSATAPPPAMAIGKETIYSLTFIGGEATWYGSQVWKEN